MSSTSVPFPATPPASHPSHPSLPSHPSSGSISSISSPISPQHQHQHPQIPKNYHPYLIQSTSSSLLTRSNSSPTQPLHTLGRHRPSRSMSSLSHVAGSPSGAGTEQEKEDRRKSMESPSNRPMMKRSGTLPTFLEEKSRAGVKEVELPLNPKLWTPSELAQYLGYTLRTGGTDGTGQTLPAPLVEDIKSWVLRQRVTGRAFLRGNTDSWGSSSRPPPFLPTLLSISRRLRRASIQGGVLDREDDEQSSTLIEENEDDNEDEELSGVKRMAHRLEARDRDSASDMSMSEDEGNGRLKPQLTGGSEGWERWGVKRHHTGESGARLRRESTHSVPESRAVVAEQLEQRVREASPDDEEVVTPLLTAPEVDDNGLVGTIKASDFPSNLRIEDEAVPQISTPEMKVLTLVDKVTPRLLDRTEATPRSERSGPTSSGLGLSPEDGTPTNTPARAFHTIVDEKNIGQLENSKSRYASLRQGQGSMRLPCRRSPSSNKENHLDLEGGYDSSDDLPGSSTMRKVTIKPNHVNPLEQIFDPPRSAREEQLEHQLKEVMQKVTVLEKQLELASRPQSPSAGLALSRPGTPLSPGSVSSLVLDRLGLVKNGEDGLPTSVGELPAYLFFVGFGVGAVMMRVIFGRVR